MIFEVTDRRQLSLPIHDQRSPIGNHQSKPLQASLPSTPSSSISAFQFSEFQLLPQELPSGLAAVALNPGIIDTEMLQSTFGASSADFPAPATWAEKAVPFLEKLGPRDNGKALTVPQS